MGCEYYVSITLQIICKDDIVVPIYIELERKLCYYHYEINEKMFSKEEYEKKQRNYIQYCLTPVMEPLIIYENGDFIYIEAKHKYKNLIERWIENMNDINWSDIHEIIKVERRYERC